MTRLLLFILFWGAVLSVKSQPMGIRFTTNTLVNNLAVKNIPSYITAINGKYKLHSENISLQSKPRLSFEAGGELNLNIYKSVYLTSGALLGYRDFHLTYRSKNFLFDDNKIIIQQHIYTVAVPVCIQVNILKHLNLSFLFRNVFSVKRTKNVSIDNPDHSYILTMLTERKNRRVFGEINLDTKYQLNNWSVGLAYIRSVTPLEKKITNGYFCQIPANIYFSTVALQISYRYPVLFRSDKKNTSGRNRQ